MTTQNEFSHMTDKCAFCGAPIEPNYYNACDDCKDRADREPEKFIDDVLK